MPTKKFQRHGIEEIVTTEAAATDDHPIVDFNSIVEQSFTEILVLQKPVFDIPILDTLKLEIPVIEVPIMEISVLESSIAVVRTEYYKSWRKYETRIYPLKFQLIAANRVQLLLKTYKLIPRWNVALMN